jgi:hypothetical protein
MDINYKLYLDGNLINDTPRGLDDLLLSISREDGFSNSEQIFRDIAESQLEFWGDGFTYLCDKRKENICEEILLSIETSCNDESIILFEGLIKQSKVEVTLKKCIAKVTNIKDNSFSGLIRDIINVEVDLFNTKTKNCESLILPVTVINTPTTPNTYVITDINTYDVLDVMKYLIAFFTDNRITVKSNYLTNVKYSITTGYNMHNTAINLEKSYPKVSFEKLFNEIRKKETVFIGVEYETDGTPYLRVEDENYFYSEDDLLMVIQKIPLDAVEKLDGNRLFNAINVGSGTTKLKEDTIAIVSQSRLTSWNKETYIGCGGCGGEKDTTLDLISDFIIDANIIHEAMNQPIGADYDNDDAIFLLNYYNAGVGTIAWRLVGNNLSNYNERLNNQNVLQRWVGISNSCIAVNRYTKYGFKAVNAEDVNIAYPSTVDYILFYEAEICPLNLPYTYHLGCHDEIYDNQNSHSIATDYGDSCSTGGAMKSMFTCQENGIYKFHASSDVKAFKDDLITDDLDSADFEVRFVVYQDNTLSTIIASSPITSINYPSTILTTPQVKNFDIESPPFNLSAGNIVMVEISIVSVSIAYGARKYVFHFYNSVFELLSDNTSCEDITDETGLFKPFVTDFDYNLCLEDYLKLKNNKKGYILLEGKKAWIKKVEYRHKKKSTLYLIHKESYCGCE